MTSPASAPPATAPARHGVADLRVSPLELFFDLVFVFTITQLTASLAHHLTMGGLARVLVMLAIIWWMYDAFIWLSNAMPPSTHPRRGLHLMSMAAFLVIAMTIPHAFDGGGWAFGWAYLVVVVAHTGMFATVGVEPRAVTQMGVFNILSGGLIVVGGYLEGSVQLVVWLAAFALQFTVPRVVALPAFTLSAAHFVERHGLVVIVAFGESVICIGAGAGEAHLTVKLLAAALLSLVVCVALWWAYFGHDDEERAVHFMAGLDDARRNVLAVRVYNFGHYCLLLGVLLLSTGAKSVTAHPTESIGMGPAVALASGVALFLVANTAVRRTIGLAPLLPRLVTAAAVLALIPLGAQVNALGEVGGIALVLALLVAYEEHTARKVKQSG
ncbi:low temperature requirement protein A [Yinghuangia seranimata]|uniref:low temperature requirement protein A n=1 Tax=Yinghuangia seranimata TaxID=408067 RepID=UPI00248B09B9|nr:low temperature requirement protein A [Yinghuangia seranimata]MDI2129641.1 low temperature requirement protein A [Yinghuangia seranimata]